LSPPVASHFQQTFSVSLPPIGLLTERCWSHPLLLHGRPRFLPSVAPQSITPLAHQSHCTMS